MHFIKAIPLPYGSISCTYHQLKYSSPNRSKKLKSYKRSYLSENGSFGKKRPGEWAKSRKG